LIVDSSRMVINVKDCSDKRCVIPQQTFDKCIGTNCMGWVWTIEVVDGDRKTSTTHGYCGMVLK